MTIDPKTLKVLELHVTSFLKSLADQPNQDVFILCDLENAKKIFNGWLREIANEKEQLSSIRELCPDGLLFINKLDESIILQKEYYNNLARWREFLKTRLDTSNRKSMEENRKFILKNRELASRITSLLYAANELLKNETGLDINNYPPHI
jgi:hypothetical protein